jgi:hypothetical protein
MRHALRYHGGFERNFEGLKPGSRHFQGTDGGEYTLPEWPAKADGIRVSYMEKTGKRFAAVRVEYGGDDIVLRHEVVLEPGRHMGFGQRLSPEPTEIGDEVALALLDDMIARNPEQRTELERIRSEVRAQARVQSERTREPEPETTDRAP